MLLILLCYLVFVKYFETILYLKKKPHHMLTDSMNMAMLSQHTELHKKFRLDWYVNEAYLLDIGVTRIMCHKVYASQLMVIILKRVILKYLLYIEVGILC